MNHFLIGVVLESFGMELKQSLAQAAKLGIQGIQVYATQGELLPERMGKEKRVEFRSMVSSYGLQISALCGDYGRGFYDPAYNAEVIEKSKRVLDLAKDLGTDIVTTHIGVVPDDVSHPRYGVMQDACGKLADYADSIQAHFAVETGPERPEVLKAFLDGLHSTGVAVNLDPANLVMTFGLEASKAVYTLKDYIVHTHAKDGVMYKTCDPELAYNVIQADESYDESEYCMEVPLGEGGVDWDNYFRALDEIGYNGYLTIEREVGDDPARDIQTAVHFLKKYI